MTCCQKRFLWTHRGTDLASHPVVGLVLQEEDTAEMFQQALDLETIDPLHRVSKQGPCFTAIEEAGNDELVS